MTGVRIDVWLWAARFFKSRALAKRACELGRVEVHQHPARPAREVRIGDMIRVTTDSGEFEIEVLVLSEIRGPASEAQKLYRETDESKARRKKVAEERKTMMMFEPAPVGRPSKRDRRRIVQFRGRG
jgi:ribosome-associated heat shock protein Hsp15